MERKDFTNKETILYFLYDVPLISVYLVPTATLFSIIYTLGQLNTKNELIAYYNSGTPVIKTLIPIIIFTAIISFLYVGFEDSFIYKNHIKHITLHEKLRNYNRVYDRDKFNITLFGRDNKIYFAQNFKPKTGSLHEVQILYIDKKGQEIKKLISAKKILYIPKKESLVS